LPYCLEFDPYSRNLFVGSILQSHIEAIDVDNLQSTIVHAGSQNETGVGQPMMLAINHVDKELYWIDSG
jgi:hypothetical protein